MLSSLLRGLTICPEIAIPTIALLAFIFVAIVVLLVLLAHHGLVMRARRSAYRREVYLALLAEFEAEAPAVTFQMRK